MDRRRFLAGAGAAGLAGVAGCAGLGGPRSLGAPAVERDDDGAQAHFIYRDGDRRRAVVSLDQRLATGPTEQFRLRLHVWHADDLRTERMRYTLRAPPSSPGGVPAAIYLKTPDGGPWPKFTLKQDDDLATVIAVDGLGELGRGSLVLELVVQPRGTPADEIDFDAEVGFAADGVLEPERVARASTIFEPVFG